MLNLSEYYEDLCFTLASAWFSRRLMPKLNMGGMYWHDIGARPQLLLLNTFGRFQTKLTKIIGKNVMIQDLLILMALLLTQKKKNLIATAITDQHFITTRECFQNSLQANQLVNGTGILTIQTGPKCYGDVEFVAWSYTHPLAIIQLVKDQINQPQDQNGKFSRICFDNANFVKGYAYYNLSVKSYKSHSTLSDPLNSTQIAGLSSQVKDICNDRVNYVCSGPRKVCQPAKPLETKCFLKNSSQPFDYINLEVGGYVVADGINLGAEGINMQNEMAQKQSILVYLKLQPFLGSLCIYLNLCDPYTHTYNSSAPFFSEFFYGRVAIALLMLIIGAMLVASDQKVLSKRCTCDDNNSNYDVGDYVDSANDMIDSASDIAGTAGDVLGDVLGMFG
uniref:Uncharacterized protein n=1 Tax=Ditylenchus dipsaci TaxID=166011 RepID=A0A915CSU9_9BILA